MSEADVIDGLTSAAGLEPEPPDDRALAELPLNDLGNSRRLIARHGPDLLVLRETFNQQKGQGWLAWDGRRWAQVDGWAEARKRAHRTADAIYGEAAAIKELPPEQREGESDKDFLKRSEAKFGNLWGHAIASGNSGPLSAMLSCAAPYLQQGFEAMDADPLAFNVANGTLVLGSRDRGGGRVASHHVRLVPHDRADRITQLSPVTYDPEADCPIWRSFLARVVPDEVNRVFLQIWFGYVLTGLTSEQRAVLFHGRGANGKSQMLIALRHVFGDYAVTLPFESLTNQNKRGGGEPTPDLCRLPGKRLVMLAEPSAGSKLSEGTVKAQTGGEPIMARPMYANPFEFSPTHKLVLSFNIRPRVTAQDEGTWRRLLLVPFEVIIPEAEREERFAERRLIPEASGILNWLLDGYRLWAERGLLVPDSIRDATQDYRSTADPLGDWVQMCCEDSPDSEEFSARLWHSYLAFCRSNELEAVNNTRFGRECAERWTKRRSSVIIYRGVRLSEQGQELADQHEREGSPSSGGSRTGEAREGGNGSDGKLI